MTEEATLIMPPNFLKFLEDPSSTSWCRRKNILQISPNLLVSFPSLFLKFNCLSAENAKWCAFI